MTPDRTPHKAEVARLRQIPHVKVSAYKGQIELTAPDFWLVAEKFTGGAWHFLNHRCSVPSQGCHFPLRKLIHEALNG